MKRRKSVGAAPGVLLAVGLWAQSPALYAGETNVEVFVGGKFYSTDARLGRDESLRGDSESALQHSGILGVRLGYLFTPRLGIEGELGVSPTGTRGDITKDAAGNRLGGSQPQYLVLPVRAHLVVNLMTGRLRPFALLGGGVHLGSPIGPGIGLGSDVVGEIHAGAGLRFDVKPEKWGFRLDGRVIFPQGFEHTLTASPPEGEVLAAIYGRFGSPPKVKDAPKVVDSDGDGVPDALDRCVAVAGLPVNSGCPDKDSDSDSLVDRLDKCPTEVGPSENGGCPDKDGDGDGVVDRLDRCPDVAGDPTAGGCLAPDTDGDGLLDKEDKCPSQAGPKDNQGCPDTDQDSDGVVDRLDKCPAQPETKNSYQDEDGCPDEIPQALKNFTGAIQGINFQPGKAIITQGSFKVLDKALAVLKEFATVRLEISGHTDNSGEATLNTELSRARAQAVRTYFLQKGIDPNRLTAVGYGPDKPLVDNKTAAGKAKNRRVEFALIK